MSEADDTINALREALGVSPDNAPLRNQLGKLLLGRGFHDEAEKLFREGLDLTPQSEALKLGLARCYHAQGKHSAALVVVEELIKRPDTAPDAHLLHARLLLRTGDLERAGHAYHRAIDGDPSLADEELAQVVGAGKKPESDDIPFGDGDDDEAMWDDDDVDEQGRIRMRAERGGPGADVEMEKPTINFDDVGGMNRVKDEVRLKIIEPMNNAELFAAYGKSVGGGGADVRPARLRQDPPGPRDRRAGQRRVHHRRHPRRARHIHGQLRAETARDF